MSSSKPRGLLLHLKKQLCEDIERLGGIALFSKGNQGDQTLHKLLDGNQSLYGKRGHKIRLQIRNCKGVWGRLQPEEYEEKVLKRFNVKPYRERHLYRETQEEEYSYSSESGDSSSSSSITPPSCQRSHQSKRSRQTTPTKPTTSPKKHTPKKQVRNLITLFHSTC